MRKLYLFLIAATCLFTGCSLFNHDGGSAESDDGSKVKGKLTFFAGNDAAKVIAPDKPEQGTQTTEVARLYDLDIDNKIIEECGGKSPVGVAAVPAFVIPIID